jgi:chromosome segregation ATPase
MGRFCVRFLLPLLLFLLVSKVHAFGMMSKEKKGEEMTCDALMAKSLVLANEGKAAAESQLTSSMKDLDKITRKAEELQAELQATTNDLTKRLNHANERISHIKKESKDALEQKQKEWELAMANAKEEAISEIRSLKDALQQLLNQKDTEVIQLETNYEKLVSAIRAEALLNVTAMQTETEALMKALVEKHEEEVATLQQQSNRLVEETNKKAVTQVEAAEEKARLQISDIGERAQETKKQYEQHLAKLTEEMKSKEEESKQLIADVTLKASEQMKEAEQNSTIEIAHVTALAKIETQTAMEEVKETHSKLKKVERERDELGEKYKEAFEVSVLGGFSLMHSSPVALHKFLLEK